MNTINSQLTRRLHKEVQLMNEFEKSCHGISAAPINNDKLYEWSAVLIGPSGTPYAGGTYFLKIVFPSNYPIKPPRITFDTPIYHPNISTKGSICLDLLQDKWSPSLSLSKILLSISSLLDDPNPNDPLNTEAANMYNSDKPTFLEIARTMTISNS